MMKIFKSMLTIFLIFGVCSLYNYGQSSMADFNFEVDLQTLDDNLKKNNDGL